MTPVSRCFTSCWGISIQRVSIITCECNNGVWRVPFPPHWIHVITYCPIWQSKKRTGSYNTIQYKKKSSQNIKQESPPAGNSKRRTARGITCYSVTCPAGTPSVGVPNPWLGVPHLDLFRGGTGTPGKDMDPVEVLWDGNITGWRWGTPLNRQTPVKT